MKRKYKDGPFPTLKELKGIKNNLESQAYQLEGNRKSLNKQQNMIVVALKNIDSFLDEGSQGFDTPSVDNVKTKELAER